MIRSLVLSLLLLNRICSSQNGLKYNVGGHDKKVVCYWGSWANYRPDLGKFTPENVDATLCTHLIYSFAGLSNTSTIMSLEPWLDLEDNYGLVGFRKATDLKILHLHLKVTLAIRSWNEGSLTYSKMAESISSRCRFYKHSNVHFMESVFLLFSVIFWINNK